MSGKKSGMKLKSLNKKKQGFTLIELIVAISIMGVLLIVALPQVRNIQEANKKKKYLTYEKSMLSSSKLYIDSTAKDLFGNNNSGCVRVKYSELKNKNLIKDFAASNITCADDKETFVEVRKIEDEYRYKINITCEDKHTKKEVYETKEVTGGESTCSITPDTDAPKIEAEPANTNNRWYNIKNLPVKLKVTDVSGLNSNITIKYDWYNKTTGKTTITGSHSFKNKEGVEIVSHSLASSKRPQDAGGKYRLTISPDDSKGNGVQDALGNKALTSTVAQEYWIDNEAPKLNGTSLSSADNNFQSKEVTLHMKATDNFTATNELKVYISNTGFQTGGSWKNYSPNMNWTVSGSYNGGTRTIYVSVKDLAGNVTQNTFSYRVYLECQQTSTSYSSYSSCNVSCGSGTKTRTRYVYDRYTGTSCSGNGTIERDACYTGIDCCSRTNYSGSWRDITGCNVTCGTGTKKQEINLVSAYNGASCGTATRDVSCDTGKSCCTGPTTTTGNWSSCKGKCGTGTKTRTVTTTQCNGSKTTKTESANCNTGINCCSQVTYKDGNNCTKTCGGGTKNQLAYSKYDSKVRCTSKDKSSGGSKCNTKKCCTINDTSGCPYKKDCREGTYIHKTKDVRDSSVVGVIPSGGKFYIVSTSGDYYYGKSAGGVKGYVYKTCLNDKGPYCGNVKCKG